MPLKIKICGITNSKDALAAVEAGADALGFILHEPSPRHVPLETAAEVIRLLPPFISRVGVFVNASQEFITRAVSQCGFDTVQFHGDEPPEFCRTFRSLKTIKAIRIKDKSSLEGVSDFGTDALLLDSFVMGQRGGSGVAFQWDLVVELCQSQRVILAGGLTPNNVAEAVQKVSPYAVDVSSGVEESPGKKDLQAIRAFIRAARSAA